jgi:lipoprotein-anchoring transpeptidase ErfK/SrfK
VRSLSIQARAGVLLAAATVAAVGLTGCAEERLPITPAAGLGTVGRGPALAPSPGPPPTASTTAPDATAAAPALVDAIPATDVIAGGPKGLAAGAKGPAVSALEARLGALRFSPGAADGTFDRQLALAVMAFQKQQDLPRTGRADQATLTRLATAPLGTPLVATGEPTRVEIDLPHQIAQFWKDGRLLRVLAVSTGSGAHYCAPKDKGGACDIAITPGGAFRADRKIRDVRVSALGTLYDPVYFYGGIAIHGSPSIPPTAASHGCVRVAMWESQWVYDNVAVGDPVYVVGGKTAPVPFGETAPVETPDEVTVPAADAPPPAGTAL